MKKVQRQRPIFSGCGLNCGLCPRYHTDGSSRCPGCGGEGFFDKRPNCGVVSCLQKHGGIEFCYLCGEYPCKRLENAECVDSFITHRHMRRDFDKAREEGLEAYLSTLRAKMDMLEELLREYNDGRRKSFYCLAVNLLELEDVQEVLARIRQETGTEHTPKEKAAVAVRLFEAKAAEKNVELKLGKREKPEA